MAGRSEPPGSCRDEEPGARAFRSGCPAARSVVPPFHGIAGIVPGPQAADQHRDPLRIFTCLDQRSRRPGACVLVRSGAIKDQRAIRRKQTPGLAGRSGDLSERHRDGTHRVRVVEQPSVPGIDQHRLAPVHEYAGLGGRHPPDGRELGTGGARIGHARESNAVAGLPPGRRQNRRRRPPGPGAQSGCGPARDFASGTGPKVNGALRSTVMRSSGSTARSP